MTLKRILALMLSVMTLLSFATSCGQGDLTPTETAAAQTETEEVGMIPQDEKEQDIVRILVIGNSGSKDVFLQLGRVFKAQGFGGKKYTLGFLYYAACTFYQHASFGKNNLPKYDYCVTESETFEMVNTDSTLKYAPEDKQWDVILLHPGTAPDLSHEDLKHSYRKQIEAYVNEHVPTEHVFGYLHRAPSPDDPVFFSSDWWAGYPKNFFEELKTCYNTENSKDYMERYKIELERVKTNILTDPTYEYPINAATGIAYAHKVMGVPQTELYRDYIHLSDFGRVLAAYTFYAQFTGEPIDEVKLDQVPAAARMEHYRPEGDLVLTEEMKHIIKESANYSLEHPWDSIAK